MGERRLRPGFNSSISTTHTTLLSPTHRISPGYLAISPVSSVITGDTIAHAFHSPAGLRLIHRARDPARLPRHYYQRTARTIAIDRRTEISEVVTIEAAEENLRAQGAHAALGKVVRC